ncbi:MAG TPA: TetR/AcrR family transcriptional regulator [Candidatus Cybelea sp.]|jgi:AcrR family transcriptional regulator
MAYEVTKRIKGRDYRYLVEPYRDLKTKRRKTKWTYVGAVHGDGVRPAAAQRPRKRVGKDDIIAAAAKLLQYRDPEFVTVDVIAREAGISRSTFYRHFTDEQKVLSAALARIADDVVRSIPPLDSSVRTLDDARKTFRRWSEAKYRALGFPRAIARAISDGPHGKTRLRFEPSLMTQDPFAQLAAFLRALHQAGIAVVADADAMARAILSSMFALKMTSDQLAPKHEICTAEFEEIYNLFDRAIFLRSAS